MERRSGLSTKYYLLEAGAPRSKAAPTSLLEAGASRSKAALTSSSEFTAPWAFGSGSGIETNISVPRRSSDIIIVRYRGSLVRVWDREYTESRTRTEGDYRDESPKMRRAEIASTDSGYSIPTFKGAHSNDALKKGVILYQ